MKKQTTHVRKLKAAGLVLGLAGMLSGQDARAAALPVDTSNGRSVLIGHPVAEQNGRDVEIRGYLTRRKQLHTAVWGSQLIVRLLDAQGAVLEERMLPVDAVRLGNTSRGYPRMVPFTVSLPGDRKVDRVLIQYEGAGS